MTGLDAPGRATFHHIEYRPGIRPTAREIRWLKHIERHGPQSSHYLHELTSDTHRDPDTTRRQLQKLRAGALLVCPRQQRATEHASFNPYIYDLGERGRDHLRDHDLAEPAITPRGHWVHQYMTACITGSIDIAARRAGVTYIPAHAILARNDATLDATLGATLGATQGTRIGPRKLIPDQLFGLDYGGRFRFFCVEADRGTEPGSSAAARKSHRSMLEGYRAFIGEKLYKAHYGLGAGLLLLAVFASRSAERRFLALAGEVLGGRGAYILTQTIPDFHEVFRPPALLEALFSGPWHRPAGHPDFRIDQG